MKAIKKSLAFLVCLCLVFSCMTISVFAAKNTGSITIKNPTTTDATVEGKTFELYRIFYATTDGQNTSYSWYADKDNPEENPFYEFFAGIEIGDGNYLVTSGKNPENYDNVQTVVEYINTNYSTNFELSSFAELMHQYIVDEGIPFVDEKIAGNNVQTVVFDELDYGYYLVYDATEFASEGTSAVRSAVMVDTVNSDITITLKANRPELEKKVLENDGETYGEATSSEIGETVNFKISTHIPSHDYYDSYDYYIEDTLPEGLTLEADSVAVMIDSDDINQSNFNDYCVITEDIANNSFKVEFTETALIGNGKLPTNTKIEIVYNAVVNDEISLGINKNTAKLYYSNDPKEESSIGSVEDDAYVYTYMFVLSKFAIDSSGNISATTRLSGAQFEIYRVDENGDKSLMTFSEAINPETGKLMYIVGGSIDELTVLDGESPGQVSNPSYFGGNLGDITIFGLKEGTYYIKETKAPAGYVLPDDGFEITITDRIDGNGNISILNATVGQHSGDGAIGNYGGEASTYLTWLDIGNNAGSVLPNTGGIGTTLFTILGIVLMAGAAAFFTVRKRSSAV